MKTPHKHADVIKAWADGAEIQFNDMGNWSSIKEPFWRDEYQYRIKPEPKPDIRICGIIDWSIRHEENPQYHTRFRVSEHWERDNIELTFDGETGALKSAVVLTK